MTSAHPPIANLALQARAVALRHKSACVDAEHLLWALCRTEEGRRAVEDRGGDYPAILRHLALGFRAQAQDDAAVPVYSEGFHRALGAVEQATQGGVLDAGRVLDALGAFARGDGRGYGMAVALSEGRLIVQGSSDADGATKVAQSPFDPFSEAFSGAFDDAEEAFHERMLAEEEALKEAGLDEGLDDDDMDDDLGVDGEMEAVPGAPVRGLSAAESRQAQALAADPNAVAAFAALRNLTQIALEGKGDPIIGRALEIDELRAVLERRRKPNALLVGEPGVGKTALVEGLAQALLSVPASSPLAGRMVVEVEMGALMAGTRFRGDFEARMRHVLDFAASRRAILFIDEAHALIGAGGGAHSGGMDAATLLKPALARGEMSVILATTPAETRALVKDRAFARRFQRVLVKEPDVAATIAMLARARGGYEAHHGVTVPEEIVSFLVEAMDGAAPERRFPDKAFDALDAAAAAGRARGSSIATRADAEAAVFAVTGVRLGRPLAEDLSRAGRVEAELKAAVLGQDEAMASFARSVRLRLLGLQSGQGCASAHLFNGPSGVGKTEAAKALARTLGIPLVRIDMSEFMEQHAVSGLIGAAPGYVGSQEDGLLVAAGEANPRMVLLLDEVDKAHPRVFDLLLQIMDAGRLTSPDGRVVSFRGAHLVMTANIGAADAARPALGFGRERNADGAMREAVAAHFRPEFAERLSTAVNFVPLTRAVAVALATRALAELMDRFAQSDAIVHAGMDVAEAIIDGLGEGPISGRRIARAVEARVADAVALDVFAHPVATPLAVRLDGPKARLERAD